MTYSGVKLPDIQENYEADMEIDQQPSSHHEAYDQRRKESRGYSDAAYPSSTTVVDREDYKYQHEYQDHAAIRAEANEKVNSGYNARAVPPAKGDDIDRSQYEVNESLQMTTFKPDSDSTPAGIDFDEFGGESRSQEHTDIDKL